MLSRASLLSLQRPLGALVARTSTSLTPNQPNDAEPLYQRRVRADLPGPVRFGFIPEEWFTFFYKKTGVTGPYAFGGGLLTYLCSKEIYIMEHEFYAGISFAIMLVIGIKKLGPGVAKALNDEAEKIEADWNQGRVDEISNHEESIKLEKTEQWRAEGQLLLVDAKQENIALQLEAAYRERLARVFTEVKRRLDYQVACQLVERSVKQKHLVNWVVGNVLKSITPDQEKENINKCIADLGVLAGSRN